MKITNNNKKINALICFAYIFKHLLNISAKFLHSHKVAFQKHRYRTISQKCNGNTSFSLDLAYRVT